MTELTFLEKVTVQEFRLDLVDDCVSRTKNLSGLLTAEEALRDIEKVMKEKDLAMWKHWDMDGYEPDVSVISLEGRYGINCEKFYHLEDIVSRLDDLEDERSFESSLRQVEAVLSFTDEEVLNHMNG
jgi:hypothetical protein